MSIVLSALFLVGVASGRHIGNHGIDAQFGPIELTEARRICASLCMAGLGGKGCGEQCQSISPIDLPVQLARNETRDLLRPPASVYSRRRDACPLLCDYSLGEPLCSCSAETATYRTDFYSIDFDRICSFFCVNHDYNIIGCRSCSIYRNQSYDTYSMQTYRPDRKIDWDAWCRERCAEGDGGVACNCDILPLSLAKMSAPEPETKE
ncbi:PREDICTED: uncharacterized protein LOC108562664 [Nicrophorus vespilloides]|uniref:Uncharacterized protein LOC108562664 n=1 Tax=Nicrophorus vespilloides TaxID=110193 RepID=A0ABM1MPR8_NICVS|nr:PREDICTED: uncharacterized protein LOC108562664 [Nicrophorus vespilloides]